MRAFVGVCGWMNFVVHMRRWRQLASLLGWLLGVGLLVFSGFAEEKTPATQGEEARLMEAYSATEEARLARLCQGVAGVGRVEVGIYFSGEVTVKYASGKQVSEVSPEVVGVVVVCDGGNNDLVKRELTALIAALYDLPSNHIHISPMA